MRLGTTSGKENIVINTYHFNFIFNEIMCIWSNGMYSSLYHFISFFKILSEEIACSVPGTCGKDSKDTITLCKQTAQSYFSSQACPRTARAEISFRIQPIMIYWLIGSSSSGTFHWNFHGLFPP